MVESHQTDRRAGGAAAATRRRPSFRVVLLLVILPQVALAVGLTGWLAYRSGRRSIEDVAVMLREQYTQRIQENLSSFFDLAPIITRLNQENAAIGQAAIEDLDVLGLQFWKQLQVFESLGWIAFGRRDGAYVSLQRITPGVIEIDRRAADGVNHTHELLADGSRGRLLRTQAGYDPRVRPWYQRAAEAGRLVWTAPYKWEGLDILCLDAVAPVTDAEGQLLGVLDAGFSLSGISEYLAGLHVGSGRTFIVERSGELVASSTGDVFAQAADGTKARLAFLDSVDPLAREAARTLHRHYGDLSTLHDEVGLQFPYQGSRIFLQVAPLNPAIGLDWLIVVAVSDADFMTHVDANTRSTLIACIGAMLLALALSLLVVRWLARPLMDLARRARRIQAGDLAVSFVPRSRDEIGVLTETMGEMVEGLKEREFIRDAFGRYVTEEIAHQVMSNPDGLELGGKLQRVTILMSDLRGFSVLSSHLGPADMVGVLNRYLGRMTDVIIAHGGMINEFIGDAILVLFGAPQQAPDDAERAMRCAIAMQLELDALNAQDDELGDWRLEMGIGVDSGEVIVGNIGSAQRVKYGVVGDAVNMAARIESLTVGGQILVSHEAFSQVGREVEVGEPITVKVKGRAEAITVYELLAVRDDPALRLRAPDEEPMREVALAADLYVLRGKTVIDVPVPVRVTRLSDRGLEFEAWGQQFEQMQNVRLHLRDGSSAPPAWYAKVRRVSSGDDGREGQRCLVTFTGEAERTLEEQLRQRLATSFTVGVGGLVSPEGTPASPEHPFLERLASAPVTVEADRALATRMLLEIVAADGVVQEAERQFVRQFIDTDVGSIEQILAFGELTAGELAAASEGPVRETMLMAAWATALCDADLAEEEISRLTHMASGLGIADAQVGEIRGIAQAFIEETAFAIAWPADTGEGVDGSAPRGDRAPEGPSPALTEAYADLIERWVPRYGELMWATLHHIPPGLAPTDILELGCGNGHLSERLMQRYPKARLILADKSEPMIERCTRRFAPRLDRDVELIHTELTDLERAPQSVDLIVSSIALHHLTDADKRTLFNRIVQWLRPGGCLSYSDIFLAATEAIQAQHVAEWRRASFALGRTQADWAAFMERASAHQRPARLDAQLAWLAEAGFEVVDCTWKHSMWTNVLAIKGYGVSDDPSAQE